MPATARTASQTPVEISVQLDNSAVFHRDTLDAEHAATFDLPWIFETDEAVKTFATEDEACAAQRAYRLSIGANEITGAVTLESDEPECDEPPSRCTGACSGKLNRDIWDDTGFCHFCGEDGNA